MPEACRGFTLTELAMVLIIVGLLIGGMLMPLSAQNDLRRTSETRKTLADINDALLGFAAANDRLPCPAIAGSNGSESPVGGGNCDGSVGMGGYSYAGFVPAATLGITPANDSGFATDGWGNPIRYAVFPQTINGIAYPFTTKDGMKNATLSELGKSGLLSVCSSGAAVDSPGTATAACTSAGKLTDKAVAVIYSLGKNAGTGGTGEGEMHNPNPNTTIHPDPAYVSHTPTPTGSSDGEFDDIVIWLSPNILYNRMIAAGRLP